MSDQLDKPFGNPFDLKNYKDLVVNIFNRFDFSDRHSLEFYTDDEKKHLEDFTYLGTYEDTEKKSLDVLVVELKGGSKVQRARSLQRNLIGKYLKRNLKDSALVAFYSKDNDWRLSFVRMEYKLDAKGVKVDMKTPPKRYSFLVGKNEPSYTATKQLERFLNTDNIPTVDEIEKTFSIEKVTEEFYNRIAKMFTKLVGGERKIGSKKIAETGSLKLPSTTDDTVKKEFAVRLIGRLLFCWFLKKKHSDNGISLIPNEILSSDAIGKYPLYYHSLLETLFFQVLNTPVENRDKRVYSDPWNKIPFLNGGLFEPHHHDFYAIDDLGTSKHLNTLKVLDEWIKELFKIFEEYNFTIDESSTIDIEISVDPEMLGRIFEKLLAEINPETGETARKSTGSYYTPRPIVEYMVDESLKQYLITQTGVDEGKIAVLLSYAEDATGLTETETDSIIDALDRVKIIDPACGSGAFPMGILHKMLVILQKIDPESKKWVEKKLLRIDNKLLRQEMSVELKRKNWDYIHKLGIIQNSIYGVDIQPIAVEISKLRFFLSLIVDEKIDDGKQNRGVVPLPNLEFKFVAANSLIGLPIDTKTTQMPLLDDFGNIGKLKDLRDSYFLSSGEEKKHIENEFEAVQLDMIKHVYFVEHDKRNVNIKTSKLAEWKPFSDEASSWFDSDWMFGVNDGFDIVIANPPYGADIDDNDLKIIKENLSDTRNANSASVFIDFGKNRFLNNKGTLTYIVPKSFLFSEKWFDLVQSMLGKTKFVVDVEKAFENVKLEQVVFLYGKTINTDSYVARKFLNEAFIRTTKIKNSSALKYRAWICDVSDEELNIAENILNRNDDFMADVSDTKRGVAMQKVLKATGDIRVIGGKNIFRYGIDGTKGFIKKSDFSQNEKKLSFLKQPKIISQNIIAHVQNPIPHMMIMSAIDEGGNVYSVDTVNNTILKTVKYEMKFVLALLNSSLISWYSYKFIFCSAIRTMHFDNYYIGKIPLVLPSKKEEKMIIGLVDQILSAKQSNPLADTSALEHQIDKLVYALYGLTPAEIEIVEGAVR